MYVTRLSLYHSIIVQQYQQQNNTCVNVKKKEKEKRLLILFDVVAFSAYPEESPHAKSVPISLGQLEPISGSHLSFCIDRS